MRLNLPAERQRIIDRVFEVAIIIAAIATIPLTYAHMQRWDGWYIFVLDWTVWAVFAAEFAFAMAVSTDRRSTIRQKWLNVTIVVVSFPLLPELLALTRLARLVQPIRLIGGLRIGRPIAVLRLYLVRSRGGRLVLGRARQTEKGREAEQKLEELKAEARARAPRPGAKTED